MIDFQRDDSGRFAAGNRGGPGRPRRRTEDAYMTATIAGVSLTRWRKIVQRAALDAENGDAKARDFLAKYLLPVRQAPDAAEALPTIEISAADAETLLGRRHG